MPPSLWLRDSKVIVNEAGQPIICDHCPCLLPDGDDSTPVVCCDEPGLVLPDVLWLTGQANFGGSSSCFQCYLLPQSWIETFEIPLLRHESMPAPAGMDPAIEAQKYRQVWLGTVVVPVVVAVDGAGAFYPPYPDYPHPFAYCADGTPMSNAGTTMGDVPMGEMPCWYLAEVNVMFQVQLYCEPGNSFPFRPRGWVIQKLGGSSAGVEISDVNVQCDPFAIVQSIGLGGVAGGAYPPGSEAELCGSRHCTTGGTAAMISILE